MSQDYCTAAAAPREAFPGWLFSSSILPRLLPVALDSKAPAVDPDTGLHLAFTRTEWPTDDDVDQWLRTRWLPRCSRWRDCTRCRDLPDASPRPGCNLGLRSGRLWRGAPSLTIFDVDRADQFGGVPQGQESGFVSTPHGFHLYGWVDQPLPPEDRPWGELRQGLNEYVVAPGSVYPWGRYTPVEPFQISFWRTKNYAGLFQLQSNPETQDTEPAPPPRHRVMTDRRALLGRPVDSPQRHNAIASRVMRALGLLKIRRDYGAILGLLREHNAVFTDGNGRPDPLTGFELERLARSYARMQRPAEHSPTFLARQARKSALAIPPRIAAKDALHAAIRASAEGGMSRADLAALHGVSPSTVYRAMRS